MVRVLIIVLSMLGSAFAQRPVFTNARFESLPVTGGLERSVHAAATRQSGAAWIGYAVPAQPGMGRACCWSDSNRGCGLEGEHHVRGAQNKEPVKLEGATHVAILVRVEGGTPGRLAAYATDCPLDAGGLPVYWLGEAKAGESVAVLEKYVGDKRLADGAVFAIAMHAGPEADTALDRLAQSGAEAQTRRNALFWLGQARGRHGYEVVARAARQDPDNHVREHAIFVLSQSKEPENATEIIRIAKEDKNSHVRGQALFWLAQMASKKAEGAIAEAVDRDPDTEVKKAAVFALTQLPESRGVPSLIEVARHNANPAVRKQAFFWLGQSKDERALQFLESVLTR